MANESNSQSRKGGMKASRAGSALVIVLGALALLAVITAIYVSLGRSDRYSSVQLDKRADYLRTLEDHKDYFLGVIAEDVLATAPERNAAGEIIEIRESWDIPWLDPTVEWRPNNPNLRFTPFGRHGDDGWLSSTEPTVADPDIDPAQLETPEAYARRALDWLQISNLSPDGRAVNLFNLRLDFDARPGTESGEISGRLTDPFDDREYTTTELKFPATTTTRQRGAYRDVTDLPANVTPDMPAYLPYQWVDADGDGFYDSRLFELVDAGLRRQAPEYFYERDPDLRFFYGIRVMDLGGFINVGTAGQLVTPPDGAPDPNGAPAADEHSPLGTFPGDVDVRRVLTLSDMVLDAEGRTWGDILSTLGLDDARDYPHLHEYSTFDPDQFYSAGERAFAALELTRESGITPGTLQADFDNVIVRSQAPLTAAGREGDYLNRGGVGALGYYDNGQFHASNGFGIADLGELLTYRGLNDPEVHSRLEIALEGRFPDEPNPQDPSDYSPLLSNVSLAHYRQMLSNKPVIEGGNPDLYWLARELNIRSLITTHSGARAIKSTRNASALELNRSSSVLSGEWPADAISLLESASERRHLFERYAEALMPYANEEGAWGNGDPQSPLRTMHYGHSAELAAYTSAFMAVNLIDMYDDDETYGGTTDRPTVATLVLTSDSGVLSGLNTQPAADPSVMWYPAWLNEPISLTPPLTQSMRFYLNEQWDPEVNGTLSNGADSWLTDNVNDLVGPPVINIYGTEVQPFITHAASFIMYTDSPDNEDQLGLGGVEINIDGALPPEGQAGGFKDYVFDGIAFQLTNPFDETIYLSGQGMVNGQTVTPDQYAYSIEYAGRWYKLQEESFDLNSPENKALTLGPKESRVFVVLSYSPDEVGDRMAAATDEIIDLSDIQPMNGIPDVLDGFLDGQFTVTQDDGTTRTNPVIIPRFSSSPLDDTDSPASALRRELHPGGGDATVVRLWRTVRTDPSEINGAANYKPNDMLADRLRLTGNGVLGGTEPLKRRLSSGQHDVAGTEAAQSMDNEGYSLLLMAEVMRPTTASADGKTPFGGLPAWCLEVKHGSTANGAAIDGFGAEPIALSSGEFIAPAGDHTLDDLLDQLGGLAPVQVSDSMHKHPEDKSSAASVPSLTGYQGKKVMELYLTNNQFAGPSNSPVPQLRVGDLLLPMAVGAYEDPLRRGDSDRGWTTLGEALAMGGGHDDGWQNLMMPSPGLGQADAVFSNYFDYSGTLPISEQWRIDRGHVALEQFTPFIDDGDGLYNPDDDILRSPGVPMALNIFNTMTTFDPEVAGPGQIRRGVININTAPLRVLRALPLLSPSRAMNPRWTQDWWGIGAGNLTYNENSDIAAVIAAWRDQSVETFKRGLSGTEQKTIDARYDANSNPDPRFQLSGLDLREGRGFRSLGELAAVNVDDQALSGDGIKFAPHSMNALARDKKNTDVLGVDSFAYPEMPGGTHSKLDDMGDDYDEQLAIMNALANSVTVRSDIFAVWFVIQGYRRADVEAVTGAQPIVPAINRRYLMVVDRSNVTQLGDLPEILLFTEVPN